MAKEAAPSFVRPRAPDPDQLNTIRKAVAQARDLRLEIENTNDSLKTKKQELTLLERVTLPDLFNSAGITNIGLEPSGDLPGYEATRDSYVHANIAESWPDEKKNAAFKYLQDNGGGDLIKATITVLLPMKSTKERKEVIAALKKLKVEHTVSMSVPWASLTSFIREMIKRKKQVPPLDVLGADIGEIVKLKPRSSN